MKNESRSMNVSLQKGATDGSFKRATPDREDSLDTHWEEKMKDDLSRKLYDPDHYGNETHGADRYTSL